MTIKVRFKCGHDASIALTNDNRPICVCGETEIARTFARAPKFRGAVSGPYAESKAVEPGVVNVAPAGPLNVKES